MSLGYTMHTYQVAVLVLQKILARVFNGNPVVIEVYVIWIDVLIALSQTYSEIR